MTELLNIPPELWTGLGIGGVLALLFGINLIRSYFDSRKDNAKDSAEASLYEILSAENARMSQMMLKMSKQIETLMVDNATLLVKIKSLESSVHSLSVWEQKALRFQSELVSKDLEITKLKAIIKDQNNLISRIDARKK